MPIKLNSIDLEWLCVETNRGGWKKQVITVVYRLPNCNPSKAIECIRECLDFVNIEHKNAEHTIIGDLDFNYLNTKCPYVQSLKFFETTHNVRQVIASTTRIGRHSNSLIDLCITNMDKLYYTVVIEYHISYHLPICIIKKHPIQPKKDKCFYGRCYKNYSYNAIEQCLNRENWTKVSRELNPNLQWNMMLDIFLRIADNLCPKKMYHVTKYRPVYLTDTIIEHIKERDTIMRLARKHNDDSYWSRGQELS